MFWMGTQTKPVLTLTLINLLLCVYSHTFVLTSYITQHLPARVSMITESRSPNEKTEAFKITRVEFLGQEFHHKLRQYCYCCFCWLKPVFSTFHASKKVCDARMIINRAVPHSLPVLYAMLSWSAIIHQCLLLVSHRSLLLFLRQCVYVALGLDLRPGIILDSLGSVRPKY